jgi:hypothetical protein
MQAWHPSSKSMTVRMLGVLMLLMVVVLVVMMPMVVARKVAVVVVMGVLRSRELRLLM